MTIDSKYWLKKRVLITGATGFLGYHLCQLLIQQGCRVKAIVRELSRAQRLRAIGVNCVQNSCADIDSLVSEFSDTEILFHLAGLVDFQESIDILKRGNVELTKTVLQAAQKAEIPRFVHTSSIVAIGASQTKRELNEEDRWELQSLNIPYINSKREGELLALSSSSSKMNVVVVNPASVIGPEDWTTSEFGRLCRRYWHGQIRFYFRGGANFVDVRDTAIGYLLAAQNGREGERYILSGTNRTFREFFADLAAIGQHRRWCLPLPLFVAKTGATLAARLRNKKKKHPRLSIDQAKMLGWYFFYDHAKATRELNYQPRPWSETIQDTYQFWMKRAG